MSRGAALEVGRSSAASAGHIGLKLYHCSGAAAIVAASASAIAWVARWSAAGSVDGTSIGSPQATLERAVRLPTDRMIGRIRDPVLAASVAGPAGSVVHAPNSRTGMPSLR